MVFYRPFIIFFTLKMRINITKLKIYETEAKKYAKRICLGFSRPATPGGAANGWHDEGTGTSKGTKRFGTTAPVSIHISLSFISQLICLSGCM